MRMYWYAGCHIWIKYKLDVYKFSAAKILPNPKLEKKKKLFFYTRSKQAIRLRFTGISSR